MKTIIDGKLYDTETATLVSVGMNEKVFLTKKGNWFKETRVPYHEMSILLKIGETEAKRIVGLNSPDRYEKYFGRPEEA